MKDYIEDYNLNLKINNYYLDEGPRDGEIVYLLHGEPAWSYLFLIPVLTDAGYRVIAPEEDWIW